MAEARHISLSELQARVARALDAAFPLPVWVAAEIAEMKVNGAGHCYMELVEKGVGSGSWSGSGGGLGSGFGGANAVPKASARAVVWRSNWASLSAYFRGTTGTALEAGMKVLVKAVVSYHELYGFSLVITDIDPSYTLGEAERARQQTIARLKEEGVWDMNRAVELPLAVQRIAVISSAGAAGYRDFMQELGRFALRFEVELFEAVMQGAATDGTVVEALERIAERAREFDAVVVIRGGGSVSDLSAFDSYRLCAHIAQFPLAVLTGIGHDKDRSVADMVAFREFKTPTAVAVWLAEELAEVVGFLDGLSERVSSASAEVLSLATARLDRAARILRTGAVDMTRRTEMRLERLAGEVARRSGERLLRENLRLERLATAVGERPGMFLALCRERLEGFERIVALRRPENILALGFSIVRFFSAEGSGDSGVPGGGIGRAVTDASALGEGQVLEITLARGKVKAKTVKEYGKDF